MSGWETKPNWNQRTFETWVLKLLAAEKRLRPRQGLVFAFELKDDVAVGDLGGKYVIGLVLHTPKENGTLADGYELLGFSPTLELEDVQAWVAEHHRSPLVTEKFVTGVEFNNYRMAHKVGQIDISQLDDIEESPDGSMIGFPGDQDLSQVVFQKLRQDFPQQSRANFVRRFQDEFLESWWSLQMRILSSSEPNKSCLQVVTTSAGSFWKIQELGSQHRGNIWAMVAKKLWDGAPFSVKADETSCSFTINSESVKDLMNCLLEVFCNGDVLAEVIDKLAQDGLLEIPPSTIDASDLLVESDPKALEIIAQVIEKWSPESEFTDIRLGGGQFSNGTEIVTELIQAAEATEHAPTILSIYGWLVRTFSDGSVLTVDKIVDLVEQFQHYVEASPRVFFAKVYSGVFSVRGDAGLSPDNFDALNRFLKLESTQLQEWQARAVHDVAKRKAFREDERFTWLKDSKFAYDPICAKDIAKLA